MGRRWGKTVMGGSIGCTCAFHGAKVAWIAPSYKNSRPLWRFAERHCRPLDGQIRILRAEQMIEFPHSDGLLALFSAENATGIRGWDFDLVIVDECASIDEDVIEEVIEPTLADRDGIAYYIGTPKGRNWFWRGWNEARADGNYTAAFHAPSSDNPMATIRHAAELARQRLPERVYRQEWLAEFVDDAGGVFRGVRKAATSTPADGAVYQHRYVIGVDWAQVEDWTVLSVIDATERRQVAIDRFNQIDYGIQRGRLVALWERFGRPPVIAELNSIGRPIIEELRKAGVTVRPFTTTNTSKAEAIEALTLAFEKEDLKILPDAVQIMELEAYEAQRLPSGLLRYSAPAGMHDDTVMALALAWHDIARRSVSAPMIFDSEGQRLA